MKPSPEVLLPLAYALSRPLLSGTPDPIHSANTILPTAFFCAISFCHLERMVSTVITPSASILLDTLVQAVSLLLKIIGNACWWIAADVAVQLGSTRAISLSRSLTHETMVGVLGLVGTLIAFVLPLACHAWQEQQQREASATRAALHPSRFEDVSLVGADAVPSTTAEVAHNPVSEGSTRARRVQLREETAKSMASSPPFCSGGVPESSRSAGTAVSAPSPSTPSLDGPPEGRRELFGFRRRLRSIADTITRTVTLSTSGLYGDDYDEEGEPRTGGRRMRELGRDGGRFIVRGESIVANTEGLLTPLRSGMHQHRNRNLNNPRSQIPSHIYDRQPAYDRPPAFPRIPDAVLYCICCGCPAEKIFAALATKNDELARISHQKSAVVGGLADVLALVSHATRQHPPTNSDKEEHGRVASGHRTLLSVCLQAQALLQNLLQEHGDRAPTRLDIEPVPSSLFKSVRSLPPPVP